MTQAAPRLEAGLELIIDFIDFIDFTIAQRFSQAARYRMRFRKPRGVRWKSSLAHKALCLATSRFRRPALDHSRKKL